MAPTGTWVNTTTDGRFVGTSSALNSPAINLIGYPVTAGSTLTILTTLKTFGQGGVVFDYQGPTYFKYAVLSADGKQIVIGHVLGNANVVDATYNTSISSGTDYKLGVTLRGGLVNVSLNGAVVVSKLYNETVTQGGYGLISFKGNTSGQTSFDIVQVKTDDATYPTAILQVAAASAPAGFVAALTDSELASIVVEAKALWTAALGAGDTRLAALDSVNVQIGNLPQGVLGETIGDTIIIDSSAAGWGWFVDPTATDNSEFQVRVSSVAFAANPSSPAFGRIDLLTTVLHEMGNAMGFAEDQGRDVTGMVLQAGERRVPVGDPASRPGSGNTLDCLRHLRGPARGCFVRRRDGGDACDINERSRASCQFLGSSRAPRPRRKRHPSSHSVTRLDCHRGSRLCPRLRVRRWPTSRRQRLSQARCRFRALC